MSSTYRLGDDVAVHVDPIWRAKSNFIIRVFLEKEDHKSRWEQLWVKRVGETKFMICCIPFFAYGIALGDIVMTDGNFTLQSVIEKSGHKTIRVWIEESGSPFDRVTFINQLLAFGALHEWSSEHYLAISLITPNQVEAVTNFLTSLAADGNIQFESGDN